MQITGTVKSLVDFSNFFDQQMFLHSGTEDILHTVKSGSIKMSKLPPQLKQIITDPKVMSVPMTIGGEKVNLHIFRIGDGLTLFVQDPGTGTVLNSFVMSLITLSSNICGFNPTADDGDINKVLLDKLVAEFDKEKKRFSITDKRQKEEIIILEAQAKDAYEQMDKQTLEMREKDKEITKLRQQFSDLAESYKNLEKQQKEASFTGDFKVGAELKKKNEILRDNNKKLAETLKKISITIEDSHTEAVMCITDFLEAIGAVDETRETLLNSISEIFTKKIRVEL